MGRMKTLTILIVFLFLITISYAQSAKPDLIVKNIRVINHCELEVTVANIGKAGVFSSDYNRISIQMYVDGKAGGGMALSVFDPKYTLTQPGKSVTINWFPTATKGRIGDGLPHTIMVRADEGNMVQEANENNNTLTKRLSCGNNSQTKKTPKRFILSFNDAYLVYEPSSKTLQIAAQRNVLSYGSDWKIVRLKSFLFQLKENFWKNFYWKVNTSRKEVYLITKGTFGHYGGKETKLNIKVDVAGNPISPTRFFLRFPKTYLVYEPSSKSLQISTGGKVLSYGSDWQKCNLKSYLFDLKQNIWKGFFWRINTSRKQVYRVAGGAFCKYAVGNYTNLKVRVKVIK